MDFLFGVKTDNCVVLAADKSNINQIFMLSTEDKKHWNLGEKTVMLCIGEGGDAAQFAEYIQKNVQLYKISNGYELGPKAASSFTRRTLSTALRSRSPYFVHLVLGGWDDVEKAPYLTYMDYLAASFEGPFVFHGYGGRFCYSIMDRIYNKSWGVDEAVDSVKKCIQEIKTRFIINYSNFALIAIDKDGIRELPDLHV